MIKRLPLVVFQILIKKSLLLRSDITKYSVICIKADEAVGYGSSNRKKSRSAVTPLRRSRSHLPEGQSINVKSIFPGDNELMFNTFMRYGLSVNLLQTSFGFLGADETLGSVLSYGTGIGLKSYDFFQNGVLALDVPIPLDEGVNLDLQLDLSAAPDDLTNVR